MLFTNEASLKFYFLPKADCVSNKTQHFIFKSAEFNSTVPTVIATATY